MSNKLPKGDGSVYWSKKSSLQYAYFKSMGIHPDKIQEISDKREAVLSKLKEVMLPHLPGILDIIDFEDEVENLLPEYPFVPSDKKLNFSEARFFWEYHYKPNPIEIFISGEMSNNFDKYLKGFLNKK